MTMRLGRIFLKSHLDVGLKEFYEKLGMTFKEAYFEKMLYYSAELGNVTIEIFHDWSHPYTQRPETDISQMVFEIDNLDEIIKVIPDYMIINKPGMTPWGYMATIRDPDKRVFSLCQKNKDRIGD